eukprot:TRINITY_DN11395_c0_g1_i1.p1 TRINITY_DN11395_c0_g1~~TRINITY_DN11395_c0_g1_i1.p1  ORF type:complete len:221 (-),score=56.26 TRINITY_DN11395_c0_g1_i1:3-614(-)
MTLDELRTAGASQPRIFGYNTGSFNHFTAVVWKSLNRMGCGNAICYNSDGTGDNKEFWVCQYRGGTDSDPLVPNWSGASQLRANVSYPVKTKAQCGMRWYASTFDEWCKAERSAFGDNMGYKGVDPNSQATCASFKCVKSDGSVTESLKAPDDFPCKDTTGRSGVCHKERCDTTRQAGTPWSICNPNPCHNGGECNPNARTLR